jgi:exopolysaccharide biosynthesis predicted pyruvyltransferase EpsI
MTDVPDLRPDGLVGSLLDRIDHVLGPLLPPGTRCALLDFPNHPNVGDSAIWLGERRWLGRRGAEVVYACDLETCSREQLAARLGGGTILLHGGGNLGDFWYAHQQFREQVIQDFPDNPIIQLPQTIHFLDDWALGEARRVFNGHKDLTLLCRDRRSLDIARTQFGAASALCPDMAFALGPLRRPGPPETEVVWLARTDAESSGGAVPAAEPGVRRTDWLDEAPTAAGQRTRALTAAFWEDPTDLPAVVDGLMETQDPLAQERLARGCRTLSAGEVVVTDRLHGHILCLLLGIPHVLLDNNYGKVRGFHEAWTRGCPLTRWADSPAEALDLAFGRMKDEG